LNRLDAALFSKHHTAILNVIFLPYNFMFRSEWCPTS